MSDTQRGTVAVGSLGDRSVAVSRPLPVVEIRRPTAKRGAEDAREELDGPRCVFCDVPVAEDEQYIVADFFGALRSFHICKGHSEHPESWHRATPFNPERVRYCGDCGEVATDVRGGECLDCRTAAVRETRRTA